MVRDCFPEEVVVKLKLKDVSAMRRSGKATRQREQPGPRLCGGNVPAVFEEQQGLPVAEAE